MVKTLGDIIHMKFPRKDNVVAVTRVNLYLAYSDAFLRRLKNIVCCRDCSVSILMIIKFAKMPQFCESCIPGLCYSYPVTRMNIR